MTEPEPRARLLEVPALRRPSVILVVALIAVGTVVTGALSHHAGMTPGATLHLAAIAGGGALAAGLAAALALALTRRSAVLTRSLVVAAGAIASVAAGALIASNAMFLSSHDLAALWVILAASATAGMAIALLLGLQVQRDAAALRAAARRIGAGEPAGPVSGPTASEFAELAAELAAMTARLEEARGRERALERSRRELVAWISHDLRSPLAAIRAVAEALEDGMVEDPDAAARYFRTLRAESDRLAGMVDDLFELSRINAGALRLELRRVSLAEVVSDALDAASPVARTKGVHVRGRVEDHPPVLPVAATELGRALRNVLENAIRHTPGDGSVFVEAGVEGDRAYVSVADGCGGIPEPDLDRVFELAFRGESARTPGGDAGAGLGLAIARGIVEAHRGEITVRNEPGGCRFTVRLPLSPPA